MQIETAKSPAKRWRFQFSLRALMTFVLIYGVLWFATIKVGGASLARSYAARYPAQPVKLLGKGSVVLEVTSRETGEVQREYNYHGKVFSPMPFVLMWSWDVSASSPGERQALDGFDVIYFWIPGREMKVERAPTIADWVIAE